MNGKPPKPHQATFFLNQYPPWKKDFLWKVNVYDTWKQMKCAVFSRKYGFSETVSSFKEDAEELEDKYKIYMSLGVHLHKVCFSKSSKETSRLNRTQCVLRKHGFSLHVRMQHFYLSIKIDSSKWKRTFRGFEWRVWCNPFTLHADCNGSGGIVTVFDSEQ